MHVVTIVLFLNGFIYTSGKVFMPYGKNLIIQCSGENSILEQVINGSRGFNNIDTVHAEGCEPPKNSYAEVFKALELNVEEVKNLVLLVNPAAPFKAAHFEKLLINNLNVQSWPIGMEVLPVPQTISFDEGFLEPIAATLNALTVRYIALPPFPLNNIISQVSLYEGRTLNTFGGCKQLQHLSLENWHFPENSSEMLSECSKLEDMHLRDLSTIQVKNVLESAKKLKRLSLKDIMVSGKRVQVIDDTLLRHQTELRYLELSWLYIQNIDKNAFRNLKNIEEIRINHNQLKNWTETLEALSHLPNLSYVDADTNAYGDVCATATKTDNNIHIYVKKISLKWNGIRKLCFESLTSLTNFDLRNNAIEAIQLSGMPTPVNNDVVVDLQGNPIEEFSIAEKDYKNVLKKFSERELKNLTILLPGYTDKQNCDCNLGWLSKALRTLPISIGGRARCSPNSYLAETPHHILECDKFPCDICTCRRFWDDGAIIANCSNAGLKEMPRVTDMRKLFANKNSIVKLEADDFTNDLEFADLSNNLLTLVDAATADAMVNLPKRKLMLAGNPLVCGCENLHFLNVMQEHSHQILDFNDVKCGTTDENINSLDLDQLNCKVDLIRPMIGSILGVLFILLIIILVSIYNKYKYELQVYLYSRGLLLSWVTQKEIDDVKAFDVFISFCHEDDEFVSKNILPALENYKLCIHYRDWIAGEFIPKQISSSVLNSRRTMLVLSKNFIDSKWGMQEFRMAHDNYLNENRRLIAVIIDDVLQETNLDADLKNFLANNTYLLWGDPWFFKKLTFALPHNKNDVRTETNVGIDLEDLGEVVPYLPDQQNIR